MRMPSVAGLTPMQILGVFVATVVLSLAAVYISNARVFGSMGIIGLAVGIPILTVCVLKPFWGLLLVIVVNQVDSLFPVPYFSSVGRLCGLFVGLGWLLMYLLRRTLFFDLIRFNKRLVLFILSMGISSVFALSRGRSISQSLTITLLILMVFFLEDFIHDQKTLNIFLLTVALSIGLSSFVGIIQYKELMSGQETIGFAAPEGDTTRVAGFTLNPNGYAVMLMSGIPMLLFFAMDSKGRLLKAAAVLLFLATVVALGLTLSRTHLVGFGFFLCVFLVLNARYHTITTFQLLTLCAVLVILSAIFYVFLFDVILTRSFTFNDSSSEIHFLIMKKGWALLLENPLFGIGLGNFELVQDSGRKFSDILGKPGHNIVSVAFAGLGFFGTAIILTIILGTLKHFAVALRTFKSIGDKRLLSLGIALESGFIALLVTCLGNPLVFQRIFWIYIGLGVILWRWSSRNVATQVSIQQRSRPIRSAVRGSAMLRIRFPVRSELCREPKNVGR